MIINTLIIDDEALARQRLVNLVNDVSELNIIGECSTGKEAIKSINNLEPDLIFLDINMPDMSGENNPMYGKHPSPETLKKLSVVQSGENNGNWRGGLSYGKYCKLFIRNN